MGSRFPLLRWSVAAVAAIIALGWGSTAPALATAAPGPACGEKTISSPSGVSVRVLFANNGWVQRYVVLAGSDNPENANDTLKSLEASYGQAGVNAPPLKVISFKPSDDSGGMQIPDKAIDSCGRTLSFN
ncbi:MAG TPA: hypothetical protein VK760_00710 [Candidatus Acidoferrales bacterium]|nr:hypothetical protein [Candidatus Acidoferrales bacterium]